MNKNIKLVMSLSLWLLSGITICIFGENDNNKSNYKFKKVFFLGMAQNYQDSIAVLTDIIAVDNVATDPKSGDIANKEMYTSQLADYFLKAGHQGYICATFTASNAKSIEKLYLRLKTRIKKSSMMRLEELTSGNFTYVAVDPFEIYRNVPTLSGENK